MRIRQILQLFFKTISKILTLFNNFVQKLDIMLAEDKLTLIRTSQNSLGKNKTFVLSNPKLLDYKELFFAIYMFLITNKDFLEFGEYKVIIVHGRNDNTTFNLHPNVLIKNNTAFETYWKKIENSLESIYDRDYAVLGIPIIEINVWNMDLYTNKRIKITKNALTGRETLILSEKHSGTNTELKFKNSELKKRFYSCKSTLDLKTNTNLKTNPIKDNLKKDKYLSYITPLKNQKSNTFSKVIKIQDKKSFSVMDIETIEFKGKEIPISISIKTSNNLKLFIIDHNLLKIDVEMAIKNLWNIFFEFIVLNCNKQVIFVHNLGSFDGFFIYKGLSNRLKPDEVSCLIDSHNKFIQITLELKNLKIVFKDSYRIFQVSLNDLCDILSVRGKSSTYNSEYHNISLFNKENDKILEEFKEYSLQDSKCLYECIYKLQEIYLHDYDVDITSILSTSTLSLKIFRSKFLKVNIPILKRVDDGFIRQGYFGGATDYYQMKAENIYYYDVNSLYPFAMLKPMPFELIRKFKVIDPNFNLDKFFGYLKVEVNAPKDLKTPLLPCKFKGKTIFPTGKWIGIYFSEELKAVLSHGYQFKYIEAYEFNKIDLFTDYVNHFYEKKRNSVGPERFIAKMHLNQLYGIFGRKHDLLETRNIYIDDLDGFLNARVIKSIVPINDKVIALLMHTNLKDDLILGLNSELDIKLTTHYSLVKANVAIASAVTSYARIHMIPFKIDGSCIYSDTDSVFTTHKLKDKFIGSELGLMKDELSGLTIKEAYFLGIKKYGYQYYDSNNQLITKSVFAGVKRDSLTFEEIIKLSKGESLIKKIDMRFYKSFQNLTITISSTHLTISRSLDKALIDNLYFPLHLDSINLENLGFYKYLKRKLIKYIQVLKNILDLKL